MDRDAPPRAFRRQGARSDAPYPREHYPGAEHADFVACYLAGG
jgi:hypothetical protein